MPTYEYRCEKCGHEFEEFQSITAKPIKKCPKCGKLSVKRLISAGVGIIFRGSGFYETDYRSDQYKQAAKKESEAGKPETAAADAKVDGKAGAKSDAKREAKSAEKTESKSPAATASAPAVEKKAAPAPKASKSAKK